MLSFHSESHDTELPIDKRQVLLAQLGSISRDGHMQFHFSREVEDRPGFISKFAPRGYYFANFH